jgi:hypothetical protein
LGGAGGALANEKPGTGSEPSEHRRTLAATAEEEPSAEVGPEPTARKSCDNQGKRKIQLPAVSEKKSKQISARKQP